MANINMLKGKLVEKGVTVEKLAECLRVSTATMYRKLQNDGSRLSVGEAKKIVEALGLDGHTATLIFFDNLVS